MKQLTIAAVSSSMLLLAAIALFPKISKAESGLVQTRSCPYSCRSEGISKKYCRDWRKGNTCFVEDLRKRPRYPKPHWNPEHHAPPPHIPPYQHCEYTRNITFPSIRIKKVYRTEKDDRFLVSGTIAGSCLSEAGYYEKGRHKEKLHVTKTPSTNSFPFTVYVRSNKRPELRVKNVKGGTQRIALSHYLPARYDYEHDHDSGHDHHSHNCRHPQHRPDRHPHRPVQFSVQNPWLQSILNNGYWR